MELDMVAYVEIDKVADIEVDMVANINIYANIDKLFRPEAYLACASSKLFEFI